MSFEKRLRGLPIVCYGLIFAAWLVDLLTPQLFVAAILFNGPIALSGLALSGRLTTSLVILAEVANLTAGYMNGLQAGHHWDSSAVANRMLSAASFVLVGYLTTIAQNFAREAGRSQERSHSAARERQLRRALEAVRETLNVELVFRAIVREAATLLDAREALLLRRNASSEDVQWYTSDAAVGAVHVERRPMDPTLSALFSRVEAKPRIIRLEVSDPAAALILGAHDAISALALRVQIPNGQAALFLFFDGLAESEPERFLQAFADGSGVALAQASLYAQLSARNDEISAQRDEIERRNGVIRDIVYALAHDLRTPLNAQSVTMQQALDGAYGPLPPRYLDVLRTSLASNAEVRRLVETLLLVARFESGESSRLREPLELADEARRVVDELLPVATMKNVRLTFEDQGSIAVAGDPGEVRRAISNLVANALESTPPQGAVTVRTMRVETCSVLQVEDDGYGVPADQRVKLFERFMPGDRRAGAGTGLGLYIVRLIADKMGGSVTYAAREPRGSVFRMSLPSVVTAEHVG